MTDTRYLVHGVFWDGAPAQTVRHDGGSPVLRLQSPSGDLREVSLEAGARLGFAVADHGRFCLGHYKVHSASSRDHILCPASARAVKGKQCERCFVLDDSRLIHDFHRGGRVPDGLRTYLLQDHWLYVATFAGGASKVGTASHLRKWNRLAEQGAVVARYVARAEDGRVVRLLEDMVTREAGLAQQVRSAAKAEALAGPLPAAALDGINERHAAAVRTLLGQAAVEGFSTVDELWVRPAQAAGLCASTARHTYPHPLEQGKHGFGITALSGTNALASVAGTDAAFVVNLGRLAARTIVLGDFASEVPAVQESLF
ncbi:DUF2797 domain-containing protein [Pseudarthrobacter cellobiosi]|uniref:DUF2797 domain-containing protein n=1 Tax=Pseudarthrobacter cellobiosi TaxID=2953654 RepID=UPI00208F68EC|nr:DUF2797 domain-containing protein [Pseudarthrobacter sp. HLT1-5]MCO4256867.1 DUF2797 domain-containing protein [Pseudarthrobacter sp. HLT1-5]